jgi:membrane protein DedA with SNARE-associated domain
MSLHIIAHLRHAVVHYGYWAVGGVLLLENIGLPLPGETVLMFASFLAYSEHDLQLPWIILVGTAVTTVGGGLGFALGHHGGRPLLDRYRRIVRIPDTALVRGENLFARFGAITVFFARFVFGVRVIAGPLAGVLRMPWRKFLVWNFFGAAAWVTTISTIGYLFGRHWNRMERVIKRFDIAILILVALLALFWWYRNRLRNGTGHLRS